MTKYIKGMRGVKGSGWSRDGERREEGEERKEEGVNRRKKGAK